MDLGNPLVWLITGLAVAILTYVLALLHTNGNLRAAVCMWRGEHRWSWQRNLDEEAIAASGCLRYRWVGIYRCTRCFTESRGAARWEQKSRELRGEPTDNPGAILYGGGPGGGKAEAARNLGMDGYAYKCDRFRVAHDPDLHGHCRVCCMTSAMIAVQIKPECPGKPVQL